LREAYTIRNADGSPLLTYLQVNRETFVELIPARPGQQTGITHYGMQVGSIDQAVEQLRQHGMRVADPGVTPANARFVRVRDPNDIEIEVMEFGPEALQRKAMESWQP
jgi:catechol 2,3-dioxygenase-like lactoylglutathione lyase family enzyme